MQKFLKNLVLWLTPKKRAEISKQSQNTFKKIMARSYCSFSSSFGAFVKITKKVSSRHILFFVKDWKCGKAKWFCENILQSHTCTYFFPSITIIIIINLISRMYTEVNYFFVFVVGKGTFLSSTLFFFLQSTLENEIGTRGN